MYISDTIQLAGKPSTLYREVVKYQMKIQRMVDGYQYYEPPYVTQLAVLITVT